MELERAPDGRVIATEQLEEGLKVRTILLPAGQARKLALKLIKQFSGLFSELLQQELAEEKSAGEGDKNPTGNAIKNAMPRLFEEIQKTGGIFDVYENLVEKFMPQTTAYRTLEDGQDQEFLLHDEKKLNHFLAGDMLLETVIVTFCLRANFKSFLDAFQSGRGAALFQAAAGTTKTG